MSMTGVFVICAFALSMAALSVVLNLTVGNGAGWLATPIGLVGGGVLGFWLASAGY